RDRPLAHLPILEGLDHALLDGHPPDPAVALDHEYTLDRSYCLPRARVKSRTPVPTSRRLHRRAARSLGRRFRRAGGRAPPPPAPGPAVVLPPRGQHRGPSSAKDAAERAGPATRG